MQAFTPKHETTGCRPPFTASILPSAIPLTLKRLLPFLLAFVLPLVAVYAWWGGFNPVRIETAVRGPYTYAYVEHTGDYARLAERLPQVRAALEAAGIRPGAAISILYSHPGRVPREALQARVGYLVKPHTPVPAPLRWDRLPARTVRVAQVRAAMLLAPSLAYQALDAHLRAEGKHLAMPAVEIYEASGSLHRPGLFSVEVEVP